MYIFFFIVKEHAPLHWVILHAVHQIKHFDELRIGCGLSLLLLLRYVW